MTRDEYDGIEAVNFSTLKHILKTPAHYLDAVKAQEEEKTEEEKADDLVRYAVGTLSHAMVLENKDLRQMFAIKPKDMKFNTREGKEWKQAQLFPILTHAQSETVKFVSDAIANDKDAQAVLKLCPLREHALVTEIAGVKVKALLDAYGADKAGIPLIPDVKTAKDISRHHFEKAIEERDYDMQAEWYSRLATVRHGLPPEKIPTGIWITATNCRPYLVQCYAPKTEVWESGRRKVNLALERLIECRRTGKWPAYGGGLQDIGMPRWKKDVTNAES